MSINIYPVRMSIAKYIPLLLFLVIDFNLLGQNDSVPKFYKDSNGKFFVAIGTEVYLYIGTSTDASKSVKLNGENGKEPLHWSGHGLKSLSLVNQFSGQKVIMNIFADALPPKTSFGFDSSKEVHRDDITYVSGLCIIELNAKDQDAGLKDIYYSINGDTKIKYTVPIKLKSEGNYKLTVCSFDNVGNKEVEASKTIVVDNTPPVSILGIEGDKLENIVSSRSRFDITSFDAIGVQQTFYSIDSSAMLPFSKSIRIAGLHEGEHTINYYSVDDVGNIEPTKSFNFFLDKTPPMVFEEVSGNTYMVAGKEFSSGRSQLKIAAVDNKAGIKEIYYSINNADFKLYNNPVYLSDIVTAVNIRSFAIDNVNNKSESNTQSEVFTMPLVDITGPQISYSYIGPKIALRDTTWIGPKTKIQISTTDIGSGVNRTNYKEKGGEETLYTEPFSNNNMGFHEVTCTTFDNVDNVNILTFGFGVDNQPPSIFYHFSLQPSKWVIENNEKVPVFSKGLKIFLGATDNISGVDNLFYIINGTKETIYSLPIEGFKIGATNIVAIKASDVLGNISGMVMKFRIE